MGIGSRARTRFDRLRAEAAEGYAAALAARWHPPPGVCLSTVARVVAQRDSQDVLSRIAAVQAEVGARYDFEPYRAEALHVSLLGCTPRFPSPGPLHERLASVRACARDILVSASTCVLRLDRLNVIGIQAFIEVIPETDAWARLRTELGVRLESAGETPLRYADPEPVHLNIGRFGGADTAEEIGRLASEKLQVAVPLVIDAIELVITDFSLSAESFETIERFELTGPDGLDRPDRA